MERVVVLVLDRVVLVGNVGFAAENGLDLVLVADVVEGLEPVEVPVVGDGAGRHAQCLGALHERFKLSGAVKETVGRMDVQMDEGAS